MLEDKIRATDWDATTEAIEEQIARESYLEWLRENEARSSKKTSATSTKFVDDETSSNGGGFSPKSSYHSRTSPKRNSDRHGKAANVTEDCNSLSSQQQQQQSSSMVDHSSQTYLEELTRLNDWSNEDELLAQVLAKSQAEYIESLQKRKSMSPQRGTTSESADKVGSDSNNDDSYASLPSTSSNYS